MLSIQSRLTWKQNGGGGEGGGEGGGFGCKLATVDRTAGKNVSIDIKRADMQSKHLGQKPLYQIASCFLSSLIVSSAVLSEPQTTGPTEINGPDM